MQGELEASVEYLQEVIRRNRRRLFWCLIVVLLVWLLYAVKEVTSLLLLSYVLALLIDPFVSRLQARGIPRGVSILGLGLSLLIIVGILFAVAVPALVREYSNLVELFPTYLKMIIERISTGMERWLGVKLPLSQAELLADAKALPTFISTEHLKRVAAAAGQTLLSGYSITLTILNLTLLPFFVFYIAADLRNIHHFFGSFLPRDVRDKVSELGLEILGHIYVFFRGQFTVALILAALYSITLSIAGLPSGLIVGVITGLLSVVPYLGVTVGLVLAMIITFVSDPSFWQIAKVLMAIGFVQAIEGTMLTPRIIGESLGIHPLGVMLALIIGGKLLGLLGLIIAIPAAAALRVLGRHALKALHEGDSSEESRIIIQEA